MADLERDIFQHETRLEQLNADLADPQTLRNGQRVRQIKEQIAEQQEMLEQLYCALGRGDGAELVGRTTLKVDQAAAARTGNAGTAEQNRYLRVNNTRRVADTDAAVASRL